MREPCYKCRYEHKPIDTEPCEHCSDEYMNSGDHPAFEYSKKQTHYDEIHAMSVEELAWELCRIIRMPFYKDDSEIDAYEVDCWARWLRQEAGE